MKKGIGLALVLALLLCACGQEAAELDMDALAEDLRGVCGEELYEIDGDTVDLVYGDLDVEESAVFASSGASADEVAVFRAEDEEAAAAVLETAQQRLRDREESYADYMPGEAIKLRDAVAEQHGSYVIVCVSPDPDAARSVLEGYVG